MTVVDTVEQARRPFTPEGVSVVMRERVCKGGTNGRIGDGCGFRTFSEEHVVASVPPIPESENH
jgi:hypothetical protein